MAREIRVHCHDGSLWIDTSEFDRLEDIFGGTYDAETDEGYLFTPIAAAFLYI